ncbi:MAG: DEAD/DEAH box helicase, partial [Pirellulaceae bacterium]
LVSNWKREFTTWAPEIPLCIIEGDQTRRHWQWRHQAAPVKIANYELLMRDRDVVLDSGLKFDLVVLDEAQRIKNRSSTTSQITRAISRSRSWALTGTPVENSSEDLVGIFEFLSPGYLQSGMTARRMAKAAGDYILRRTKDKVLTDLPPKLYRDAELDLTPEQWCSYKSAEEDGVIQLEGLGAELTIQHVFELVLRLKQICNFDPATGASSKLERLEADLEEVVASGQKAIVFSQWVGVLDKIRDRLHRFGILEYHGKIPSKKRESVIARFKEDPSKHVILMSYGAGSVGLNLQFCRYVFLFDRWWNPAVEDQAINRAHRIGAAGSVTVNRMLTLGT